MPSGIYVRKTKTGFIKGHTPWNKGTIGVMKAWNKGKGGYKTVPCSEEKRKKISLAQKGIPRPYVVGHPMSEETKKKIIEAGHKKCGTAHYRWISDRTKLKRYNERDSSEYRIWQKNCKKRDGLRCIDCGEIKKGEMEVNHIYPWSQFPRLRHEMMNGETLCRDCHKVKTSAFMRKSNILEYAK